MASSGVSPLLRRPEALRGRAARAGGRGAPRPLKVLAGVAPVAARLPARRLPPAARDAVVVLHDERPRVPGALSAASELIFGGVARVTRLPKGLLMPEPVQHKRRTEVPEPPSPPARLLPPPAAPRLPLLVVRVAPRCRRQFFPRHPRRRASVVESLKELSEASSAPVSAPSSSSSSPSSIVTQRREPGVFVKARHAVMWRRPPPVELLLVRMALLPKVPVIGEQRGSPLGFGAHVLPKAVPVVFGVFSGAVAPLRRTPVGFVRIEIHI
ncbi:hypothetical protein EYF80_056971 [Liparis tanakae]|uniref:Uncharacterized protein n=1 Tax=Liparis tanakae TaxID=230148 RepID=A0A4Z2EV93_9TELE|nr:hypothetical protein EYF80_056971 [Liparis tanakae]